MKTVKYTTIITETVFSYDLEEIETIIKGSLKLQKGEFDWNVGDGYIKGLRIVLKDEKTDEKEEK